MQWADGAVTDARICGPADLPAASYVLATAYADWKALREGYDAQRTVMYRKMLLEDGDLLKFFKGIYFFVECLAVIGAVPAGYPPSGSPEPAGPRVAAETALRAPAVISADRRR